MAKTVAQTFAGSVEIRDSGGLTTRITLDGDTADLTLRDTNGQDALVLQGAEGRLVAGGQGHDGTVTLNDAQGHATIVLDGQKADLVAGGSGQDGTLTLLDSQGKRSIGLYATSSGTAGIVVGPVSPLGLIVSAGPKASIVAGGAGQAGALIVRNDEGNQTIEIDGQKADLYAGGAGQAGSLTLRNSEGKDTFRLDARGAGKPGKLTCQDKEGKDAVRLYTDGSIYLGAAGSDGHLSLMNKKGNFSVSVSTGGWAASIVLGAAGQAGQLACRNDVGKETIHINGQAGDILLHNADCAEEFDVAEADETEPGTVMVLDGGDRLRPCCTAYDRKVAGIVSGAGSFRPGIVLDRKPTRAHGVAVALMGKVFCKVDATYAAIDVGDLLTSSPTPGYAMKAADPARAFGAVIGKALQPLVNATGLILVLVALQ